MRFCNDPSRVEALHQEILTEYPVIYRRYRRRFGDLAWDIAQETALIVLLIDRKGEVKNVRNLMGWVAARVAVNQFREAGATLIGDSPISTCALDSLPEQAVAAGFEVELDFASLADRARVGLTARQRDVLDRWTNGEKMGRNKGADKRVLFLAVRRCRAQLKAPLNPFRRGSVATAGSVF
jgi:DNA-directed RNA polymerase specialized sigma24 family protein